VIGINGDRGLPHAPPRNDRTGKALVSSDGLAGKALVSSGGPRADGAKSAGETARPVPSGEHVLAIGQPSGLRFGSLRRFALSFMPKRRAPSLRSYALTDARAGRLVSPPYFGRCWHGAPTSVPLERAPLSGGELHPCSGFPPDPRVRGLSNGTQACDVPRHGTLVPLAPVRGGQAPHGPPPPPARRGRLAEGERWPWGIGATLSPSTFPTQPLRCLLLMIRSSFPSPG